MGKNRKMNTEEGVRVMGRMEINRELNWGTLKEETAIPALVYPMNLCTIYPQRALSIH